MIDRLRALRGRIPGDQVVALATIGEVLSIVEASPTTELEEAWCAAEVDGWEVVALVRRLSRPASSRWMAQLVRERRPVYAFGPTAAEAIREARARVLRIHYPG